MAEIVEILVRLDVYFAIGHVYRIAVFQQDIHNGDDEEHEERHKVADKAHRSARAYVFVVNVVDDVKYAEDACKEEHCEPEYPVPAVEQGVESVACVCPPANYGACAVEDVGFFNNEVRPIEECRDGDAEQQRSRDAVDD